MRRSIRVIAMLAVLGGLGAVAMLALRPGDLRAQKQEAAQPSGSVADAVPSGGRRAPGARPDAEANGEPVAVPVEVRPLSAVVVYPEREAQAGVVARNESRIAAEVSARIIDLRADVAQQVERGQVLARLDDADFRLALASAKARRDAVAARLELAQAQLERGRTLQQQNFLSPEALKQRETEVAALRAEVRAVEAEIETAERQLQKTLVRAPYTAAVTARTAQLGELAVPGAPLFTLVQIGAQEVSASVPLALADDLASAAEIAFETAGRALPLRLLRISPIASKESRSREARLAFVEEAAIPGSSGRLVWRSSRPHVGPELVERRDGRLGIFVVEGAAGAEHASFVPIAESQEGRAAPAPVALDARVVVRGQALLRDGQRLRLTAGG